MNTGSMQIRFKTRPTADTFQSAVIETFICTSDGTGGSACYLPAEHHNADRVAPLTVMR